MNSPSPFPGSANDDPAAARTGDDRPRHRAPADRHAVRQDLGAHPRFALLYVMLAIGLNLVVGFAGLLDLGYIAFYAVGACTFAFSPRRISSIHLPFWLVIPIRPPARRWPASSSAFPTLRLRGDYLAIVTLGFGEIVRIFLNNLNHPVNITNGPQGINMIDPLVLFGWDISRPLQDRRRITVNSLFLYYYVFLAFVALSVVLVQRLRVSRVGRAWAAIRDDELAPPRRSASTPAT